MDGQDGGGVSCCVYLWCNFKNNFLKNLFLFLLSYFIISSASYAQAPTIQWQKCYGGTNAEQAFAVAQTFDGGYIVGGVARSSDGDLTFHHGIDLYNDYWLVKTN